MTRRNFFDFSYAAWCAQSAAWGYSAYHADLVWRGVYADQHLTLEAIPGLRPDFRAKLLAGVEHHLPQPLIDQRSSDGFTRKFLLELADGERIETVIMRFHARRSAPEATQRYTACISTQAGCAMGCVFCATGQMGFERHLSSGEIVGQVLFVQRTLAARGEALRNIVLMGMGEPLHNYDNVMTALEVLTHPKGLALAARHITISTVGLPSQIRRLADEQRPFNLAVSLHGATDAERQALVPPAKRWPLSELLAACRYYSEKRKRRIFFEWTLIERENDTPEQAHALGQLLQGMEAHVNVIPLNPTAGYAGQPSDPQRVKAFQQILQQYGLPSTIRQRRGIDIAAGCGQLKNQISIDEIPFQETP